MIIQNFLFIKYLNVEFRSPLAGLICRWRMKRALKKWNCDIPRIEKYAKESSDKDVYFKWSQLVSQEIWMYIKLGKTISRTEFDDLCQRRGFDENMKNYLQEMFRHVKLKIQ